VDGCALDRGADEVRAADEGRATADDGIGIGIDIEVGAAGFTEVDDVPLVSPPDAADAWWDEPELHAATANVAATRTAQGARK
jgi:hypothetical protein